MKEECEKYGTNMEWISVKDRLPLINIQVLVFVEGVSYNSGPYSTIDISELISIYGKDFIVEAIEWSCKICCNETVTHWMPLPEPPKE